jgi:arylformamidase
MKIYDISWPIFNGMTTYKDRGGVKIESTKIFEQDGVRESSITIGSHTGTHIDAPAHFLKEGLSLEEINPLACVGPATVIDMTHIQERISEQDVQNLSKDSRNILLFKTKNSERRPHEPFDHNFVYLDESGARYLAQHMPQAIGIDYLGVERAQIKHETHVILLQNNIPIIEGLRLQHVPAGNYFLWCLPLNIPGIDAAPARAVLIEA